MWNDLLIAIIFLQDDAKRTLMAGISVFQGRYNNQVPLTMAGMVIAVGADADPLHHLPEIFHPRPDGRRGEMTAGVAIASDSLRVTVNLRVGGTIVQVTHLGSGLDVLGKAPWDRGR